MNRPHSHYSADNIEERILKAIAAAGLDAKGRLTPESLGALDHFHTGGRRTTLELLALARIGKPDRVLDIGAGLGGAARLIAKERGCAVVCLEPSPDYCAGARLLNRLTGLDGQVEVHEGSALDMPFAQASFDVAWMQNVGMSIADKARLYAQIRRVLRRDGRFAFQEVASGPAPVSHFPLPWATEASESLLVAPQEMRAQLEKSGFAAELFEDRSEAELARPAAGAAQGPLTLAVFVDNLAEKAKNARRALQEGQVRLVRGVFRAS